MGSQVSWPVGRAGLGVVPELGGHLLLDPTHQPSFFPGGCEPLHPGRVQGAVGCLFRAMPLPRQSGPLVSVELLPLGPIGVETPWQQLMDGLRP